jgi:hypothetical protein
VEGFLSTQKLATRRGQAPAGHLERTNEPDGAAYCLIAEVEFFDELMAPFGQFQPFGDIDRFDFNRIAPARPTIGPALYAIALARALYLLADSESGEAAAHLSANPTVSHAMAVIMGMLFRSW